AKATELLEDGGVVPTTRTGVYYTVGTEGEIYKTARTGCTCKAGINGRYACYHRIAVEIVEATYQPAAYQLIRTPRSEEHTSELQSRENLVCRLLLEKKK